MACFDSCGKNPKLVKSLVSVLGNGHSNLQDRCESRDVCSFFYRCTDGQKTTIQSYGNCAKQLYIDEVGPFTDTFNKKVYCYLDFTEEAKACENNLRRPTHA